MELAPIALFVYKRPHHTKQVLEALQINTLANNSELFVFADGPKESFTKTDYNQLQETRNFLKNVTGFKRVEIITSEKNKGLANSIIEGVSKLVEQYGKVIVIEDDIITGKGFLSYMNNALELYKNNDNIISISGYTLPIKTKGLQDTFFLKGADCWGWGTWKRGWELFNDDANVLLNNIIDNNLQYSFNLNNAYPYVEMLKQQLAGIIDSWAIRWHASAFLKDKLTLYPKESLVKNIGLDGSGTHSGSVTDNNKIANNCNLYHIPVIENKQAIKRIVEYYRQNSSWLDNYKHYFRKIPSYKKVLRTLMPHSVLQIYRKMQSRKTPAVWQGNLHNWTDAKKQCSGYEDATILNKIRNATLKVRNGETVYERDSVLFNKIQYNWPLMAFLLKAAIENENELNIIDFGGSLGSSYFQNRKMIPKSIKVHWTVVEQANFVDVGNKEIGDGCLNFIYTLKEAVEKNGEDLLLLSSVIQYLEKPDFFLQEILTYHFNYIIIDRTSFINAPQRLTIQHVPEEIYKASYPCWFFNEEEFLNKFLDDYELIADFNSFADPERLSEDKKRMYWKGFILKLKA